ncbi:MAG: hypothetical protein HZA90_19340 [Verrucomicrobia bacterium]|nr:hypothetical protein [Verrucomicrobiota bacterium]
MNDWNIQSRAHQCQACGKSYADKEPYHTLLFDEKKDYLRLDVCETCWKGQYSQGANERKGFISYWQGVYEAPPPAPPEAIKRETAETLLRKLIERNDPQFTAAAFILAVMLERKRLLKVKEQHQSEGRRVFIYEQPKTGDVFTIPDPQLQLDQLEEVQHDVAELLEHGLPGEAAPVPAALEPPASPPTVASPDHSAPPAVPAPAEPAAA